MNTKELEQKRQEIKLALAAVNTEIGGRNGNTKSFLSPKEITQILTILDSQGVAIKVDKELPERKWFNDWGGASGKKGYDTCYSDVMMAGYTATAPLIEEAESES